MDLRRKLVISNVFWSLFSLFINLLISLYLARYILGQIGSIQYGIWVLVGSLLNYTGLLDLGVSSAIVKYVAQALAVGDKDEIQNIALTSLISFSVIGIVVVIICIIGSNFGSLMFNVPADLESSFSILIVILGVGVAISFPGRIFLGLLRALERYDIVNYIQIFQTVVKAILVTALLEDSIILLGIISLSINILVHIS